VYGIFRKVARTVVGQSHRKGTSILSSLSIALMATICPSYPQSLQQLPEPNSFTLRMEATHSSKRLEQLLVLHSVIMQKTIS
jgi:hypothetical protein